MASETEDNFQPSKIFSNQVWSMILGNVKKAKDYQQISSASSYFRARMHPRATLILFPAVIKVLSLHDPDPEDLEDLLPLLEMRLVCQTWKKEVDRIFQTQEYFIQPENYKLGEIMGIYEDYQEIDDYEPNLLKMDRFGGGSNERFVDFQEHFDSSHLASGANPFLRRKVELSFYEPGNQPREENYAACFRFLKKYGHHIWFCVIRYYFHGHSLYDFYAWRLALMLKRMPNLRALHIHSDFSPTLSDEVELARPLPTLPHLEYLFFRGPPRSIVQKLLRRNPQVQYVDALGSTVGINLVLKSLPNLRKLAFTLANGEDIKALHEASFTSRVESMWLDVKDSCTIEMVFSALERRFAGNLVELHLRFPVNPKLSADSRMVLQKLKILHLEMHEPHRLDFLLPLKNTLEELHVALCVKPDYRKNCRFEIPARGQDEDEKLQVYKFWREPKKSNIWNFFPKLSVLEIERFYPRPPKNYRI